MPSPEIIQTASNVVHQLLEARVVLTDPNFLNMLRDIGHPYGLMLTSASTQSSDQSGQRSVDFSSQILSLPFTGYSYSFDYIMDQSRTGLPSDIFAESSLHSSSIPCYLMLLYTLSLGSGGGLMSSENLSEKIGKSRDENLYIKGNQIGFGTVSLRLRKYSGPEQFLVRTAHGEPVVEIQPGSSLASLHLNRGAKTLRRMTPLERIQTMTGDLKKVFALIDSDSTLDNLSPDHQEVLKTAKSAVIIGISHLVPVFRRMTGLPFWNLSVLPEAIQQFFRLDSQAVSDMFGGKRQIKAEDIEMILVTPAMRQALVNA